MSKAWSLDIVAASGCNINQTDIPWWLTEALEWMNMVEQLASAHKPQWGILVRALLGGDVYPRSPVLRCGPPAIYDLYRDYCDSLRAEAAR